jgi:hypothetical protein
MGQSETWVCGGCQREVKPGDRYIEDTPHGYIGGKSLGADLDALLVDLMTHNDKLDGTSNRLIFCEACTETRPDGGYKLQTRES